jgi:2-polyprenyl-6-methoxyphenol hydroxylase-like FAD-dependent oxidoreductase
MGDRYDVIVAGAGPAGLVAALRLIRSGVRVVVLEADHAFARDGRASTFHPPTLEMLEQLGAADRLIELGLEAPTFQYRRRADESMIAEFDLGVLAGETPYPYRLQCEQSLLTPILAELFDEAGGELRFDSPVTRISREGADGVRVEVTPKGGDPYELEGQWLIGADGSHSVVRRSLGLTFEGKTVPELFLVIETDTDLRELIPGLCYVNYVVDPVRWYVLLRTQAVWRILVPLHDGEQAIEGTDLAEVARRQLDEIGDWGQGLPIVGQSVYRVHQRVASEFAVGRCLIIGDAAHLNNPLGGMGMNAAIHDAWFLAGALIDVFAGHADEGQVAALQASRRDMFIRHVQHLSEGNWERLREPDPAVREAMAEELRSTAQDPTTAREYLLKSSLLSAAREAGLARS